MNTTKLIKQINGLIDGLTNFESTIDSKRFADAENYEEFVGEISSAIISLESAIEIVERDAEVDSINEALEDEE